MPYDPHTTYHAGDYFAAMGPRINENIQTFMNNRRDRQQMTATAEMLGRYIAKDPQAMEMFGDKLAKVPDMSLGQARGTVGGLTAYLAQQHLRAEEQAATERNRILDQRMASQERIAEGQLDVAKQGLGLKQTEADAAEDQRQRLAAFNESIGQAMQPVPQPVQIPFARQPDVIPQMDAQTLIRLGGKAGVIGHPQFDNVLTALERYGPEGRNRVPESTTIGGQDVIFSRSTGAFQVVPKSPFTGAGTDGAQAVAIHGPNGEILGYALPTTHGGLQPLPQPKAVRSITPGEQANIVKARSKIKGEMRKQQMIVDAARGAAKDAAQAQLAAYQKDLDDLDDLMPEKPAKGAKPGAAGAGGGAGGGAVRQGMGDLKESLRATEDAMTPSDVPIPPDPADAGDPAAAAGAIAPVAPAAAPPGPVARIRMIHPDGSLVGVRADQVEEALRQGFKRAD